MADEETDPKPISESDFDNLLGKLVSAHAYKKLNNLGIDAGLYDGQQVDTYSKFQYVLEKSRQSKAPGTEILPPRPFGDAGSERPLAPQPPKQPRTPPPDRPVPPHTDSPQLTDTQPDLPIFDLPTPTVPNAVLIEREDARRHAVENTEPQKVRHGHYFLKVLLLSIVTAIAVFKYSWPLIFTDLLVKLVAG